MKRRRKKPLKRVLHEPGALGKQDAKKKRAKVRRVSKRDREAAAAVGVDVRKSSGGILVASAGSAPAAVVAYLRIRDMKTSEILHSIGLAADELDDRTVGAILRQRAGGFDPRATFVDDSEVTAERRRRRIWTPGVPTPLA